MYIYLSLWRVVTHVKTPVDSDESQSSTLQLEQDYTYMYNHKFIFL